MLKRIIAALFMFCSAITQTTSYWNWNSIDVNNIHFPQSFRWGISEIAREIEGYPAKDTFSTYAGYINHKGKPFEATPIGIASDYWNHYKEDLDRMAQHGLTSFCRSIDWAKIEPTEGHFDEKVLAHYLDECAYAHSLGINMLITFKEYTDPDWFIKKGGFEKTENIALFERYCLKVFKTLEGYVDRYITFWCPDSYAMLGYWTNHHPPFKHDMQKMATVFKNTLQAHVQVYQAIKQADTTKKVQVGIAKHVHRLEPWYPWDNIACNIADQLVDEPFYRFFTTGVFKLKKSIPGHFKASVHYVNKQAPQSVDFIGINYHTHGFIRNFGRMEYDNPIEIATDIPGFTLYPEGLYHAIREVSHRIARQLNIPIYITQNGVATTKDSIRTVHAQQHLYAVSRAIKHGYNVQGYYYNGLLDGHAWGGYDKKFGLFAVDRSTMERTLKPGAQYYLDVVKKFGRQN